MEKFLRKKIGERVELVVFDGFRGFVEGLKKEKRGKNGEAVMAAVVAKGPKGLTKARWGFGRG